MLCVFGNGCLCVLLFCVPGLVLVLMGKYCWGLVILGHEEKCTHEIYWGSGTAIYFSVMGYLLMCSDSSCAYYSCGDNIITTSCTSYLYPDWLLMLFAVGQLKIWGLGGCRRSTQWSYIERVACFDGISSDLLGALTLILCVMWVIQGLVR